MDHACWGPALETVDGFFDFSAVELFFFFLAGPGSLLPPSLDAVGGRRRHCGMTTNGVRQFSSPSRNSAAWRHRKSRWREEALVVSSMSETKEFLKARIEDDEHRQPKVGSRSKHFLYHLIVVIKLVQDDGDSIIQGKSRIRKFFHLEADEETLAFYQKNESFIPTSKNGLKLVLHT